jgi:hypothetical protein
MYHPPIINPNKDDDDNNSNNPPLLHRRPSGENGIPNNNNTINNDKKSSSINNINSMMIENPTTKYIYNNIWNSNHNKGPKRLVLLVIILFGVGLLRQDVKKTNRVETIINHDDILHDSNNIIIENNNLEQQQLLVTDDVNVVESSNPEDTIEDDVTVEQAAFLQMQASPSSSSKQQQQQQRRQSFNPSEEDGDEPTISESTIPILSNKLIPPPDWYRPNVKYFIYQPSGGLSNQRKILEWALRVCQILERTCIIPPIGPHTTFYYKYNAVPYSDCSPASEFLDVVSLRKITPIVYLTTSLVDFTGAHEGRLGGNWRVVERNRLREKRESPWSTQDISREFSDEPAQFLYFSKGTMWQCFNFTLEEYSEIQQQVRFHPEMRSAARQIAQRLGKYNALHIRFSDGESNKVRIGWLKPSSTFIYRMKMAKFQDYSSNLYIATVPSKISHPYFNKFKSMYNVTFSSSLEDLPVIKNIVARFPPPMKPIALGVIEQHVCTRAKKFLGTGFSTFSEHIREMRRMREIAHDPWALSDEAPEQIKQDEIAFMKENTSCWKETRPC